ncbi:MAG: LysM peptidoglycan-binding domain-containing protein [Lachnospiraceae bacterium]|nr:LysM peptidoglycan-binding domain-containing protein [Lachnospiraceae bacterium]
MEELIYHFTRKELRDYEIKNGLRSMNKSSRLHMKKQLILILISAFVFLFTVIFVVKTVNAKEKAPSRVKSFVSVRVSEGDTVWSIAEDYLSPEYSNITVLVKEIEKTNHLVNGQINSGNYIIVPVYIEKPSQA